MVRRRYDPSLDRKALNRLASELADILAAFADHRPVVKGCFQTLRRRCGKARCHCHRGNLHESRVFLERYSGKRRSWKATSALEDKLARPVARYRKLRRLRARLSAIHREILAACDRLHEARLGEGKRLLSSRRSR